MRTHTEKIQDNSNALLVLEKAKSLNRKVRRALPGEGEFSHEIVLMNKQLESETVTVVQAAKILNTHKTGIMTFKKAGALPFEKIKGALYFKRIDVLKLLEPKEKTDGLMTTAEAAKYINMHIESFQHRKKAFNIPYTLKNKRNRMYSKEDLDQHLIDHPRRNMDK